MLRPFRSARSGRPLKLLFSVALCAALLSTAVPALAMADRDFAESAEWLYYYEPDRAARYISYHEDHPDFDVSTIVWQVDADVDLGFYKVTTQAQDPASLTALVNKNHQLPKEYGPNALARVDSAHLRPDAADALKKLEAAAKAANAPVRANSNGYRSYAKQRSLNRNTGAAQHSPDSSRARAGYSEHQTGLAVDLTTGSGFVRAGSKQAAWLTKNAWKYGYIVRYTKANRDVTGYIAEPWHVRFIGVDNAREMHDNNIQSFEEYWVKYVAHRPPSKKVGGHVMWKM